MQARSWLSVLHALFGSGGSGGQSAPTIRPSLRFLLFLAALLVLYPLLLFLVGKVGPLYDRLLAAASQGILSLSEGHSPTTLVAGEAERIFLVPETVPETMTAAGFQPSLVFIRTRMNHINLALLLALFLATPGLGLIHRLRVTLISSGILFLAHVLILLVYFKYIYAVRLGEYSPFLFGPIRRFIYEWSYLFLRAVGWPALPLAIWAPVLVPVFLKRHKTDKLLKSNLSSSV